MQIEAECQPVYYINMYEFYMYLQVYIFYTFEMPSPYTYHHTPNLHTYHTFGIGDDGKGKATHTLPPSPIHIYRYTF